MSDKRLVKKVERFHTRTFERGVSPAILAGRRIHEQLEREIGDLNRVEDFEQRLREADEGEARLEKILRIGFFVAVALLAIELFGGCVRSEVARGYWTPHKQEHLSADGIGEDWICVRKSSEPEGKIFALWVEREGPEVVAHCLQSVYPQPADMGCGPSDEIFPWEECDDPFVVWKMRVVK